MDLMDCERDELDAALGYCFRNSSRLLQALTHSSFGNELGKTEGDSSAGDNETLELLGDAVLGLAVTQSLLAQFPQWSVGRLSQARARVVSARSLHAAAVRLDLGRFLRIGRGEEKTGLREQRDVLADTYEALIAAIYLDAGLAEAAQFVQRTLLDEALRLDPESLGEPDQKSALMEWCQGRARPVPEYRVVSESGPDHRKMFVVEVSVEGRVLASAQGMSKKEAEQAAALMALAQLRDEQV